MALATAAECKVRLMGFERALNQASSISEALISQMCVAEARHYEGQELAAWLATAGAPALPDLPLAESQTSPCEDREVMSVQDEIDRAYYSAACHGAASAAYAVAALRCTP